MKRLVLLLLFFNPPTVFCQKTDVGFQLIIKIADSLVADLKEYKDIREAAVNDLKDSFYVKRYYASESDKRSRGIKGGVIKYELGYYSYKTQTVYQIDNFIYYSIEEKRIVLINDGGKEFITPEMELIYKHADSLIETLKEYKEVKADADKFMDRCSIMRRTTDSSDNKGEPVIGNIINYEIGIYAQGIPCDFSVFYSVYYSISENRITDIVKKYDDNK